MPRAARPLFPLAVFIIILLVVFVPGDAAPEPSGMGISVAPGHIQVNIAPGDQTRESVTLTNTSGSQVMVDVRPQYSSDAGGGLSISASPSEVTMKPGVAAAVTINIRVPPDAGTGERQDGVVFQIQPPRQGNISLAGRVEVVLDENIINFVDRVRWQVPHWLDAGEPARFSVSGRNSGYFPERLVATEEVDGIFGAHLINEQSGQLAIGQSASMQATWHNPPFIGIKRVILKIGAGAGAPAETDTWLIIFPWRLSLALAGLAAATVAGFWAGGLRLRR
ncbi:MAG: hypothetical protein M1309_00455 [Actinobacteria bacterium]|nr:hypothetical protein [Actinomycetota bacterium]